MDPTEDPMAAQASSTVALRRSEKQLALHAAHVLRRCHRRGREEDLSGEQVARVRHALTGVATGQHPLAARCSDVVAFAHRLLDDDHPEQSELWTELTSPTHGPERPDRGDRHLDDARVLGDAARAAVVPDPRDLPDDGLGPGPALGTTAATPIGGWR